jgi:hypothetical protein
VGKLNVAALSTPSSLPLTPAMPASVVTLPEASIMRIVLLLESAT